jgi:16S rRNA (guanine527-N7)-methyltransferase
MVSCEFRNRLVALALEANVDVPSALIESLAVYFETLSRWNSKINLTSLTLEPPSAETFHRLLLEPLKAVLEVPLGAERWFDIGSGGGSPAIPMKLARPNLILTLVESKTRKAAFLRELIRALGLSNATVLCDRLEDIVSQSEYQNLATLITLRAVRLDDALVRAVRRLAHPHGELWLFYSGAHPALSPWFVHQGSIQLGVDTTSSFLARYTPGP